MKIQAYQEVTFVERGGTAGAAPALSIKNGGGYDARYNVAIKTHKQTNWLKKTQVFLNLNEVTSKSAFVESADWLLLANEPDSLPSACFHGGC